MEQNPPPEAGSQPGALQAPRIDQAQRRFWLIVDAMLAALVVLAIVGGWTYLQVRGSLRDLRSAGLASLLEVETRALGLWIDEKKRDAERWAATPEVQRAGAELAVSAARGVSCAAVPQRGLRDAIAPFTSMEEVAVFNLIARDGRIVSSPRPENCGAAVSPEFRREIAPVFDGKTVFVRPWGEGARLGERAAAAAGEPLVWTETPVRGADGSVVAALGFGRIATQRFTNLLRLTGEGTTRDAYAFDENGRIVTTPRYAPGSEARPPSALVQAALARDASQGVLIEPYANYHGAQVIGAWRWLPDAGLWLAVEVDAAEAYGPLEYLQVAFAALFALVLLSMTAAATTSLWAVRLRLREARRVGVYRIEREIGEGGMSNVYLASHAHLRRPAAVKVLKPHLATDEAVTRFQREAQLASQLSHPNTIEVYDYGTTRDGRWYYAMELLDGLSLESLVTRYGPMPLARALHVLRQACGSLAEAHAHGFVHRDVKPGNLMLCVRGGQHDVVKVVDFGLIKRVPGPVTRDITQYSKVLGTPLYMAPERLRDPADADARADIYALAAVAWFVLAGRPVFEARTEHDTMYRVMNDTAPTLASAGIEAPPELEALLARCLAKDRAARPGTIDEVERTLGELARAAPWGEREARQWWEAHPEARSAAPPLR